MISGKVVGSDETLDSLCPLSCPSHDPSHDPATTLSLDPNVFCVCVCVVFVPPWTLVVQFQGSGVGDVSWWRFNWTPSLSGEFCCEDLLEVLRLLVDTQLQRCSANQPVIPACDNSIIG